MLTDMTDKIKTMAEYDGYEIDETDKWDIVGLDNYLTDLNTLHPVAMRVLDELRNEFNKNSGNGEIETKLMQGGFSIKLSCCTKPNESGQYIALVDAVYKGITLLNELKEKCSPHK